MEQALNSKKELHLLTPDGEVVVPLWVEYDAEFDDATSMTVTIEYKGELFSAQGVEYPWMDAFVRLQSKLPDKIIIKGCINCRHGNMCPVGNAPYEVFCTKDVVINKPQDLWNYTETHEETSKRSREYTHVCENYIRQSKNFFTYTDYIM